MVGPVQELLGQAGRGRSIQLQQVLNLLHSGHLPLRERHANASAYAEVAARHTQCASHVCHANHARILR